MATFVKRGDKWRAQINLNGKRPSASFPTKREAMAWAGRMEEEILNGAYGRTLRKTLKELMERYRDEVCPSKRTGKREATRVDYFIRTEPELMNKWLSDLTVADFAGLRDRRLKTTSAETVRRDFNTLSAAINHAIREWEWLKTNPLTNVRRPPPGQPRERRITNDEVEMICVALRYENDQPLDMVAQRCAAAFLFALETAMRASEILTLKSSDINWEGSVAKLHMTKNGTSRFVPLSTRAMHILKQLPKASDSKTLFALSSSSLDANFRKALLLTPIKDLHFHDSRHEAITRLAKRLDVLDLARMTGHRNINELLTYYNESAESIAKLLT